MSSLLEGQIAKLVHRGLKSAKVPYKVTLTRAVPGSTEPPYSPWSPGPSEAKAYPCDGWKDAWTIRELESTLIQANDVKVCVLAPSLPIRPVPTDKITVKGQTYTVIDAQTDPAEALWVIQCRA